MADSLPLRLHPQIFGMCKLAPTADLPRALSRAAPCFIARTSTELSIVAFHDLLEASVGRFRLLGIDLTFGTTESGILRRVIDPLADAEVWVLALGTHDTDYVLVREDQVEAAMGALREAGHRIVVDPVTPPPDTRR